MNDEQVLSGQQLLDTLHNQNWETLLIKLRAYAITAFYRYRINSERGLLGKEPKDFMEEAIEMVFMEQRKWNVTAYPDLFDFIAGVIDSLISNYLSKKKYEQTTNEFETVIETDTRETGSIDGLLIASEMFAALQKELDGDDDALVVIECMGDGVMKPQQIRDDLGLSESELNNILKRIRRARKRALTKMK